MPANNAAPRKKNFTRHNVMLDPDAVKKAKKRKLNVSLVCREALSAAIQRREGA